MGRVQTRRALATTLLAVVVVTAVAGCGGGGKKSSVAGLDTPFTPYENAMLRLGSGLFASIVKLGQANKATHSKVVVERNVAKEQAVLRAAADKLEKIVPPAKIRAQHRQLIQGVREFATELGGLIAKMKHGSNTGVLAGISRLPGVLKMNTATTAITKAGYTIYIGS